ncbi:ribosomal protein S15a [Gurleya vavrai]
MHTLTATCKTINNANRKRERQVLLRKTSKQVLAFLEFMMHRGYIDQITFFDDHRQGKVVVDLNGRLIKCGSICPQYHIKCKDLEDWRQRLLPARQFGHLVVTTSKGIMDQNECLKENVGGRIVGFFY